MDVFKLRTELISQYSSYIKGFIKISDRRINKKVESELNNGLLWPDPLIQLNPSFAPGDSIENLIAENILHPECGSIFRINKTTDSLGLPLNLYRHQSEAIRAAHSGNNYVLSTGTGSGKSLSYIIPIVDHVLKAGPGKGIQAIVVYPMNALANSQFNELHKFLCLGYPDEKGPVTFQRYTGQEKDEEKQAIIENPPDILLTNYVMLELILTRPQERKLIRSAQGLQFLVLDELHTYRGRQGADISLLARRLRNRLGAEKLQCVGTSATLASGGTFTEQQTEIANVASTLFGAPVKPEFIIGETLQRETAALNIDNKDHLQRIRRRVADCDTSFPGDYENFIEDPFASWIEDYFGITEEVDSGRLIRQTPRSIRGENGAAKNLSELTSETIEKCGKIIQAGLMAGYQCGGDPVGNRKPFAFRLHQFLSKGDNVYTSLEEEEKRYITVYKQMHIPERGEAYLYPVVFCRECGQEYYCVHKEQSKEGQISFTPREFDDRDSEENYEAGYLYNNSSHPWPEDNEELLEKLPENWLERFRGGLRVRRDRRKYLPQSFSLNSKGMIDDQGLSVRYVPTPFRLCLNCEVAYGMRQNNDFSKLSTLGTEGRSTATTILCLTAIEQLKQDQSLPAKARKLLSFTDNRQDASLQAGHFNDFIETSLLRGAIYQAVAESGADGLAHDELPQKVFSALNLPLSAYLSNPEQRFQGLKEAQKAFRNILSYRIYRDLKRGWRIVAPNLEQCGLLKIIYLSLDDVCTADDVWEAFHPAISQAPPDKRDEITLTLLDFLRKELAIKVDFLDQDFQERIIQQSNQYLIAPWAIDENEKLEHAAICLPRSRQRNEYAGNVFLSGRSAFGQYLRRRDTFTHLNEKISLEETQLIIQQLLEALQIAGILEKVREAQNDDDVCGYQLVASALRWQAGDGTTTLNDPLRLVQVPETGKRVNPFFADFYRSIAFGLEGFEAREHTAQVPANIREEREKDFREGNLPILFCSPTMELGVDISQLNVVNMRNTPPTPANYAQRSGRAGRSGQPALVFTYCSVGSPHDQYFFRHPHLMVAGSVLPPRIDLGNEDLVRSHVQAIWLAETGIDLGKSLNDILDLSQPLVNIPIKESGRADLTSPTARNMAVRRAKEVLTSIQSILDQTDWYHPEWLHDVLGIQAYQQFDHCCDRWRNLYRTALQQAVAQDLIIRDASRSHQEKEQAKRLRREAESQITLLTESDRFFQADFYSYRYFASEGFLPGYNFPRLPLSAYIPGRRQRGTHDDFLSRPRFLAVSEFGPRAHVYHEGSRYEINKVILPVHGDDEILTTSAKLCPECGYINKQSDDTCILCQAQLQGSLNQLFRLHNVVAKRRDKISSDEEERLRLGYELYTSLRFADRGTGPSCQNAIIEHNAKSIATFRYGQAATLWRINYGWRRRAKKEELGFFLNLENGYWQKRPDDEEDAGAETKGVVKRVIPFAEDRKNCLLFEPTEKHDEKIMISLQAALKKAIQVCYQLEDNELAAEPLPSKDNRKIILIYEAAEGGAGVLRHLANNQEALSKVATTALSLCHFNPTDGKDLGRAEGAQEPCGSACYDCLLSYSNQMDHPDLDRHSIKNILLQLQEAEIKISPANCSRSTHMSRLKNLTDSQLERKWLDFLESNNCRLPEKAQYLIESCGTRPDFFYDTPHQVAVYIDGPPHDFPDRHARDLNLTECLEDAGYIVLRFHHEDDWGAIISRYPNVFGELQ